jgi:hypothetical protein
MKEPIKAKTSGLVFERATIELWITTRGSICPVTNEELTKDDLEPLEDLRNRYCDLSIYLSIYLSMYV